MLAIQQHSRFGQATQIPGAPDVGSCSPQGDSPFGVADMVGTVWQYTTSFVDQHDRNVLTRGSSNYRPGIDGKAGSHWYYPDARQLDQHEKMKMMCVVVAYMVYIAEGARPR